MGLSMVSAIHFLEYPLEVVIIAKVIATVSRNSEIPFVLFSVMYKRQI